jgi:hypothetical protein
VKRAGRETLLAGPAVADSGNLSPPGSSRQDADDDRPEPPCQSWSLPLDRSWRAPSRALPCGHQKVGTIDDLIIAPDTTVSFAIVGAGGFAGLGKHDVAIPMNQFTEQNGRIILVGATKEAIKALPKFEYAKK